MADHPTELPSHASPIISPVPRPSAQYLHNLQWNEIDHPSQPPTPGIPDNLISPAFTPPLTPNAGTPLPHDEQLRRYQSAEPHSTPVDTSKDDPTTTKQPRLLERLPLVECVVRARIPTTSGAEMFLHLYQNNVDNKEHLAIVFGNTIRSRSLDAEKPGETEMDRMIRGAYIGRLRPGRVSSRIDDSPTKGKGPTDGRQRSGSALKNVTNVSTISENEPLDTSDGSTVEAQSQPQEMQDFQHPQAASVSTAITTAILETSEEDSDGGFASKLKAPLVRIHSECYTGETAWSARCDCGEQLDEAARLMSLPSASDATQYTGGVIVYLRQEGRGIGLASKLKAYNLQDLGNDTVEANLLLRHPADARSYGLATAILQDLGLGTDNDQTKSPGEQGIRLLTNNPDKVRAVEGPGREVRVVERVAMVPVAWRTGGIKGVKGAEIEKYLETKIGRMGHMLER